MGQPDITESAWVRSFED